MNEEKLAELLEAKTAAYAADVAASDAANAAVDVCYAADEALAEAEETAGADAHAAIDAVYDAARADAYANCMKGLIVLGKIDITQPKNRKPFASSINDAAEDASYLEALYDYPSDDDDYPYPGYPYPGYPTAAAAEAAYFAVDAVYASARADAYAAVYF